MIKLCRTPQNIFLHSRHTFPRSNRQARRRVDRWPSGSRTSWGAPQPLSIWWQLPWVTIALKQEAGNDSNRVSTAKTKGLKLRSWRSCTWLLSDKGWQIRTGLLQYIPSEANIINMGSSGRNSDLTMPGARTFGATNTMPFSTFLSGSFQ